jgi:hypothetical protein
VRPAREQRRRGALELVVVVRAGRRLLRDEPFGVGVQPPGDARGAFGVPLAVRREELPRARAHVWRAIRHHHLERLLDALLVARAAERVPLPGDKPEPPRGVAPKLDAAVLGGGVAQAGHQLPGLAVVQHAADAVVAALGDDLHGDHHALEELGHEVRRLLLELAAELGGQNHQQVRGLPDDGRTTVRHLRGERPAKFRELRRKRVPLGGAA